MYTTTHGVPTPAGIYPTDRRLSTLNAVGGRTEDGLNSPPEAAEAI